MLKRTKPLPRNTKPIRKQSKRKAAERRVWERVTRQAIEVYYGQCAVAGCTNRATAGHHLRSRAQGGESTLTNCLPVCFEHHNEIHANPSWAVELGYIIQRRAGSETL